MKHKYLWILMILFVTAPFALSADEGQLPPGLYARFNTRKGDLLFLLNYERLPRTVANFVALAEGKMDEASGPYYSNQKIYHEIEGYALFLGDPDGTGKGGLTYTIPRETGALLSTGTPGALVMNSRSGEDHGSQVMIMITGDPFLDRKYTAFGQLQEGENVLEHLHRDDVIESVEIIRVGSSAEAFRPDAESVNEMIREARVEQREVFAQENPEVAAILETWGDNVGKSETGIYYTITQAGSGSKPRPGNTVRMHYSGRLLNGQEFDSSYRRNEPFQFTVNVDGVIPGWVETAISMQTGEKRTIILPPELAYGSNAYGPIPANSWLVFDIELVDFQ
ncbi:MAG: FKBP-type peptidyl-prolyl cis-trans isomerase [Spirochaetales bacterium]|nr:FKBP-type peptidyl-prolyl cis-trans isomerase [Spirochaetales bacterium]